MSHTPQMMLQTFETIYENKNFFSSTLENKIICPCIVRPMAKLFDLYANQFALKCVWFAILMNLVHISSPLFSIDHLRFDVLFKSHDSFQLHIFSFSNVRVSSLIKWQRIRKGAHVIPLPHQITLVHVLKRFSRLPN